MTTFVPKLLPTTPVHVHASPAALVHCAVAVVPTYRHVIEADIGVAAIDARASGEETWSNIRTYGV